jgi:hypothetical protein
MAPKYIPAEMLSQRGLRLCLAAFGACRRPEELGLLAAYTEKFGPFSVVSSRY